MLALFSQAYSSAALGEDKLVRYRRTLGPDHAAARESAALLRWLAEQSR